MSMTFLRKAALLEGTTLVLLVLIAVPLKRLAGMPEAVSIIGPVHGIAFLVYVVLLSAALFKDLLNIQTWLVGLIAAFIPFGSFLFERKALRPAPSAS
jgi:integral membrane protein